MKLTVLTENSVLRSDLKPEHGMFILVQADGINFLFDTGYFGAIRENAQKLGIDLTNIDAVAFSHNHVDHTGGFLSICDLIKPDCKIYAHKGFNIRKYWDHRFDPITDPTAAQNLEQVGPAMQSEYFFQNQKYNFRIIEDDLYNVSENIYLVSNFPVQRGIEAVFPASRMEINGEFVVDEFRDEQAAVIKTPNGLVVLTGCAHNGIMNILNTVKKYFPNDCIYRVFGGTHLVPYNENRVKTTIDYFINSNIKFSGVCHCTGPAIADFAKSVKSYTKIGAGFVFEI